MSETSSVFAPGSHYELVLDDSEFASANIVSDIGMRHDGKAVCHATGGHDVHGPRSVAPLESTVVRIEPQDDIADLVADSRDIGPDTIPTELSYGMCPRVVRTALRDWRHVWTVVAEWARQCLVAELADGPAATLDRLELYAEKWGGVITSCRMYEDNIADEIAAATRCKQHRIRRAIDNRRQLIRQYRQGVVGLHIDSAQALVAEYRVLVTVEARRPVTSRQQRSVLAELDQQQVAQVQLRAQRSAVLQEVARFLNTTIQAELTTRWKAKWLTDTTALDDETEVISAVAVLRAVHRARHILTESGSSQRQAAVTAGPVVAKVAEFQAEAVRLLHLLRQCDQASDHIDTAVEKTRDARVALRAELAAVVSQLQEETSQSQQPGDLHAKLDSVEMELARSELAHSVANTAIQTARAAAMAEIARQRSVRVSDAVLRFDSLLRRQAAQEAARMAKFKTLVRKEATAANDIAEMIDVLRRTGEAHDASMLQSYMAHTDLSDSIEHVKHMAATLDELVLAARG